MKTKFNDDKALVEQIKAALRINGGYCPCVLSSRNHSDYKCPCKDFRLSTPVGETCHCGLFVKIEE